uniref:Uncharacterized protein n=1 Tax=Solanum demissum TaxID=50514 RepID=Q6F2C7_SOLDE|nr:hypothetical protein SDM1_49t00004 [Solanum demissum]
MCRPTLTPLHFILTRVAARPPPSLHLSLSFSSLFRLSFPVAHLLSLSSLLPLVSPANDSGTQLLRQSPVSSGQQQLGRRRTTGEIFLSPSSQLLHSPASKAVAATKQTSSEQLRQTTAPTKSSYMEDKNNFLIYYVIIEPFTARYVFALGVARFLSCAHWVLQVLDSRDHPLVALGHGLWPSMMLISEIVQTFILADFCDYYVKRFALLKMLKEMEVIKFEGSPQVNLISLKWKWMMKSF